MILAHDWFRDWFNSPYYHLLYSNRDDKEADAFVTRLIAYLKPEPGSLILDVACGTGRHARILASRGFDVTGIDLAPNNITVALQSANDHLHFYQHDMRELFWINYFRYVFNFFTSFGYFDTDRENSNAVRTMVQALRTNGILVLDYLNARHAEDNIVHDSEKEINGVHFFLNKWCDKNHFFKKIRVTDRANHQELEFMERVARLSLEQFRELFKKHGLEMLEVFGDYDLSAYDEQQSPRMVMIAQKL